MAALLLPLLAAGPSADARQPGRETLQRAFTEAAEQYGVPRSVLLGVSYLQSRWDSHQGAPSVSGGYGPMHLTDARTALARSGGQGGHSGGGDARGDTSRPVRTASASAPASASRELPARLRTLERAARLTGLSAGKLRHSPSANVRGGAALLAAAQKEQGQPPSTDPADWFGAVSAYPGGSGDAADGTAAFAFDVYDVLREGERRATDSGQDVTLRAAPRLRPDSSQVKELGSAQGRNGARQRGGAQGRAAAPDCPDSVSCEWLPSPYEEYKNDEGEDDYGNHDRTRRPASQKPDYIVVHDTEETWEKSLDLVRDPTYVSWNYTLRSSDGRIAQHVRNKDVGWHSGNWYVNSKSVGLEHEGFLTDPDAWFTEAMYRSSARLVRHLSEKYGIPLDRQHVLGHDNVPGVTTSAIADMHTDPGPYWDWEHYFALLGKPFPRKAVPGGELVTIRPDYDRNRPEYTGCEGADAPCPAHGSGAVRLHTAPDSGAPLVPDAGLHPGGGPSTTAVNDTGARASTGQQFAVAGRTGDWTAIWYLGEKAWFHNPADGPTAVPAEGRTVVPVRGKDEVPVYGRAYPSKAAYPEGVPVQELSPLPYTVKAGQRYAVGQKTRGEYLYAPGFDPDAEEFEVVRGGPEYYEIQLGHRVAYVKGGDVRLSGD